MNSASATYVKKVTRYCVIHPQDGIACLVITLDGAKLAGPVVIAHIVQPFGGIASGKTATAWDAKGNLVTEATVSEYPTPHGRQFELSPAEPGRRLTYQWKCDIASGCALSQRDLRRMRCDDRFPLESGMAFRPFRVRFPCGRLTLQLDFESEKPLLAAAHALTLESNYNPEGFSRWKIAQREQLPVQRVSEGNRKYWSCQYTFDKPTPNRRYAIGYQPSRKGLTETPGGQRLAGRVLEECRSASSRRASTLEDKLSAAVLKAVARAAGPQLSEPASRPDAANAAAWDQPDSEASPRISLLGQIWSSKSERLLTCFGEFSRALWGLEHRYGCEIAGHALRMGRTLAYSARSQGKTQTLLHQSAVATSVCYSKPPPWLLCIPIQSRPSSAPIGVVRISPAFADAEDGELTHAERVLATLAHYGNDGSNLEQESQEELSRCFQRLQASINIAFARTLATHVVERDRGDAVLVEDVSAFLSDCTSVRSQTWEAEDSSDETALEQATEADGAKGVQSRPSEPARVLTRWQAINEQLKFWTVIRAAALPLLSAGIAYWWYGVPPSDLLKGVLSNRTDPSSLSDAPSSECLEATNCVDRRKAHVLERIAQATANGIELKLIRWHLEGLLFDAATQAALRFAQFDGCLCPDGAQVTGTGACEGHWTPASF